MPAYQYQQGDRPLDGYTIQHALGRGGFGEVYFAVSDAGREVALKAVQNYEDIELRGIGHCMNLKSPHLVMIFDVKSGDDGTPWVIMEYVAGASLREIMDEAEDGLSPEQTAYFLSELAKGIDYLHDAGIVHRDLKPHNVFFEDGYVKIGDYSLSKVITVSHASGHTMTVGSVHYMAPEISMGKYDKTVDIYALGIMLYEMLTGKPPYVGESVGEVLMKHLNGNPDVSGVPEPFAAMIQKAMDRDPTKRYQSAREMTADLKSAFPERFEDSIPASLSLVGRSTPSVKRTVTRSQPANPAKPSKDDLADTIGAMHVHEDTAESQRPNVAAKKEGFEHFDEWKSGASSAEYLTRVGLSILSTAVLFALALIFGNDRFYQVNWVDLFLFPAVVWPLSMLLAIGLILVVPQETTFTGKLISRACILVYWGAVFMILAIAGLLESDSPVWQVCFFGTLVPTVLLDWRKFTRPSRERRISTIRTLLAGGICYGVSFYAVALGHVSIRHVGLAIATTVSAAITTQLVSLWRSPDELYGNLNDRQQAVSKPDVASQSPTPKEQSLAVQLPNSEKVAW